MAAIFGRTNIFENWVTYPEEVPCRSKILSKLLYLPWFLKYKHFCGLDFFQKFKMAKNSKIQSEIFSKLGKASLHRYPVGQKFCQNRSSCTVFKIQAFLVLWFLRKIRKFKIAAIFWQVKYLWKLRKASLHRYPVVKSFAEIALSNTVFKIQAFLCFVSFVKIKIRRHFWQVKYSSKLEKASLHRYPVGQTFCQNCSIWHGFRDTSICVFCDFCKKFKNSKWLPWQKFFENWVSYSDEVSSMVFEIQAFLWFLRKNSKWPSFFEKWNIRWNLERLVFTDTLWIKNFVKIALSSTVFGLQGFLLNGCHFWQVEFLLKLGKASLHRYRRSKILPKFH